jgi:4-hydroxy-3-methylbut-2-enyl diphosphate reductase
MEKHFTSGEIPFQVTDSICRHVSKRGDHLKDFARKHDVIIFVSGTSSSNGKVLYEICRRNNPRSYWVPGTEMLQKEWFEDAVSVGISGATSTPQWLMEKVAQKIFEMTSR